MLRRWRGLARYKNKNKTKKLKAAAWIAKKMERTGAINLPPDSPLTCDTHVLLENTRYHSKYEKEVDKRRHKFSKSSLSSVTLNRKYAIALTVEIFFFAQV